MSSIVCSCVVPNINLAVSSENLKNCEYAELTDTCASKFTQEFLTLKQLNTLGTGPRMYTLLS